MPDTQPLYDILGEAFKAGAAHAKDETLLAADSLFPLAARMESEIQRLVEKEREACAEIASANLVYDEDGSGWNAGTLETAAQIRARSLPSSPEREAL